MSSTQVPLESNPSTKLLPCQEWMGDLGKRLKAKFEAADVDYNTSHTRILNNQTGHIQRKLRERLPMRKNSLDQLVTNRPKLHISKHMKKYQTRRKKFWDNPLPTILEEDETLPEIPEESVVESRLPMMTHLSKKMNIASWVTESLQLYGEYIASDLVDRSVKQRIKKIRQCLWIYRQTGKTAMFGAKKGHVPSRSDLEGLNIQVSAMLAITTRIAKFTRLLDGTEVGPSFRPRVVNMITILRCYQASRFRARFDRSILDPFDKDLQDHIQIRARGEILLAAAGDTEDTKDTKDTEEA